MVSAAGEWLNAQVHESTRMEYWVRAALVIFCASLLLFVFINGATASGAKAAERIKEGKPAFGEDSIIDSILDLNVPKVEIEWIGDGTSQQLPATAVFIGSSNGVVTLYSPSVLRLRFV
jgi:hypothetical protein